MLNLLIDLGNSRLKWALADDAKLHEVHTLTHRAQDLDELLIRAWTDLTAPGRVVVACVAGQEIRQQLESWLQHHWYRQAEFLVSPAQGAKLINAYTEPARLGCDRWAAMVAARHQANTAFCVVDCGSAVTLDLVNHDGQHLGGLILPGVHAMLEALGKNTPLNLSHIKMEHMEDLGTSTEAAVQSGVLHAIASLVNETVIRAGDAEMRCLLTGGDAALIAPLLKIPYQHQADLVLQGLAILAQSDTLA